MALYTEPAANSEAVSLILKLLLAGKHWKQTSR